ncbi:MAG: hypothetical protein J6T28_08710 [Paludibacteraceae bacterium]|nr:hypothetical protein [Paludibacteraceae bacterium]
MNTILSTLKAGDRKSNFEALRLLSMLMVLNLHSFWGYYSDRGFCQALDFLRESTSICAVNVFILISGYFGIRWRMKGLYNLLFQVAFYSFAVYLFCVSTGICNFDRVEFFHCFKAFYDSWGFITWYIILYFLSPVLNVFAEKTDSRQLLIFIVVFWLAEHVIMRSMGENLNYFLVYLIGRWISKVGTEPLSNNAGKRYLITTFIIFVLSYSAYIFLHYDAEKMCCFVLGYSYASPFVILQAVFLFLFFSKINIRGKFINWSAASCLAIFLIHMHPLIKDVGYYAFTRSFYIEPFMEHCAILIFFICGVFCGSILVDKIRIVISECVYLILKYACRLIPNKYRIIDFYLPSKLKDLS